MIRHIANSHKEIKKAYDQGLTPIDQLAALSSDCLNMIRSHSQKENYDRNDNKKYIVFYSEKEKSRPINEDLFIECESEFNEAWDKFINNIDIERNKSELSENEVNRVIYTSIMSFCICFDLWKSKSRKTPGTHFEVLLGSILHLFIPSFSRKKFIALPNQDEKVSTDIVFDYGGRGLVIPAKITTRERIVQPYAHQRILNSIFGNNRYKSILMCVSETQRDDDKRFVNDICVPGTIKLFQEHLSQLSGLYYLDPPNRYVSQDISNLVAVGCFGRLLTSDLPKLLD